MLGSLKARTVITHTYQLRDIASNPQGHIWKMRLLKVSFPPGAVVGSTEGSGPSTGPRPAMASRGPGIWSSQIWTPGGIRASWKEDRSALFLFALCRGGKLHSNDRDTVQKPPPVRPELSSPPSLQLVRFWSSPALSDRCLAALRGSSPGWGGGQRGNNQRPPDIFWAKMERALKRVLALGMMVGVASGQTAPEE